MSFLRNPDTISRIRRARLRDLKRENEKEVTMLLLNCQIKYIFYNASHLTNKNTLPEPDPQQQEGALQRNIGGKETLGKLITSKYCANQKP